MRTLFFLFLAFPLPFLLWSVFGSWGELRIFLYLLAFLLGISGLLVLVSSRRFRFFRLFLCAGILLLRIFSALFLLLSLFRGFLALFQRWVGRVRAFFLSVFGLLRVFWRRHFFTSWLTSQSCHFRDVAGRTLWIPFARCNCSKIWDVNADVVDGSR